VYSYEDRMRAIALYIQYDHASATTIRELGYPSRKALYSWYREYQQCGDLHGEHRKRLKYSATERQVAVEHYFEHGRNMSATMRAVGYPSREVLRKWIDDLRPRSRKVPIKQGSAVSFSDEQKRRAVIALCSRDSSAESVAACVGVSRQVCDNLTTPGSGRRVRSRISRNPGGPEGVVSGCGTRRVSERVAVLRTGTSGTDRALIHSPLPSQSN
jgi:transposase-like protein